MHLFRLAFQDKLGLESSYFLVEIVDLGINSAFFRLLVLGVLVDLAVNLLLDLVALLLLLGDLRTVLLDPDPLVMQALLLLIDSKLFSLLVLLHLSLLVGFKFL